MWPNFGEISSNSYQDIVFTCSGVIVCCDLDLWPFDPKIWTEYLRTKIHQWPKFSEIYFWDMVFGMHRLWPIHGRTHLNTECPWHWTFCRTNFSCGKGTPGHLSAAGRKMPAAPWLVVSVVNRSAINVTLADGRSCWIWTAVDSPTAPAPTTATLRSIWQRKHVKWMQEHGVNLLV